VGSGALDEMSDLFRSAFFCFLADDEDDWADFDCERFLDDGGVDGAGSSSSSIVSATPFGRLGSLGSISSSTGSLVSDLRFFGVVAFGVVGCEEFRRGLDAAAVRGTDEDSNSTFSGDTMLALDGILVETPSSTVLTNFLDELVAGVSIGAFEEAFFAAPTLLGLELPEAAVSDDSALEVRALLLSGCVGVNVNSRLSSSSSTERFRFTTDFVRPFLRSCSSSEGGCDDFSDLPPLDIKIREQRWLERLF
jgi:hypothetical protein